MKISDILLASIPKNPPPHLMVPYHLYYAAWHLAESGVDGFHFKQTENNDQVLMWGKFTIIKSHDQR